MLRKVAICDDEKAMIRQLLQYISQIEAETGDQYSTFCCESAEELLEHMPRDIQVLLLDICMDKLTGMECARRLRAEGWNGEIFFITSMAEYAVEGYQVHAFAFLTKPVLYSELKRSLTSCFERMDRNRKAVLPVESAGGIEMLTISEIMYAEVYQHATSFALPGRKVTGNMQLSYVETELAPYGFFRSHRSYIVNMNHIKKIENEFITVSDGSLVPLSKYRRKEFLCAYAEYMGVRI